MKTGPARYFSRPCANEYTGPLFKKKQKKVSNFKESNSRELNQAWDPSPHWALCDYTDGTPMKLADRQYMNISTQYMNISILTTYPHTHTFKNAINFLHRV